MSNFPDEATAILQLIKTSPFFANSFPPLKLLPRDSYGKVLRTGRGIELLHASSRHAIFLDSMLLFNQKREIRFILANQTICWKGNICNTN
jgi:hypothetical protein